MAKKKITLGRAVRHRRLAIKKTLENVANDVGSYDAANLSRFERDEQGINSHKLGLVAKSLSTTVSELYRVVEGLDPLIAIPASNETLIDTNELAVWLTSLIEGNKKAAKKNSIKTLVEKAIHLCKPSG